MMMLRSALCRSFINQTYRRSLVVGAAQIAPRSGVDANVERMIEMLEESAKAGVELVVFPEAAVTGYCEDTIAKVPPRKILEAEIKLRQAARAHSMACVVGTPFYEETTGRCYNSATLIDECGEVAGRHHKLQLVGPDESWSVPGEHVKVFSLRGVKCAVIICHDNRYPELCRLPVLAGARVLFYMSCEQWHDDLALVAPRNPAWSEERLRNEIAAYRAQSQARAVENRVWLVKANTPGPHSHGSSCVIDPTGIVRMEGSVAGEELVYTNADMGKAQAEYATKSLHEGYVMRDWWRDGLSQVVQT